uniref:glutamate--tRNA ligase n=1 Tax=Peronospora matthiolae TaxID=2874970 RepID=A0AAV1UZL3_9STRA
MLSRLRRLALCRPPTLTSRSFSLPSNVPKVTDAEVRVRYAPSPTGFLHLGGLRTALFNYLFAKSCGGQFILRIEDTDKTRQVEGSMEALVDSLKWCGVMEDEGPIVGGPYGPYIQSQRLPIYKEAAERLIESGHAYRCFCTSERLKKLRESQICHGEATMYDRACLGLNEKEVAERVSHGEPHTIRLRIPPGKTTVKDLLRGYIQFVHAGIDDQVLMKSDGYPTYHLANVVDDHAMRITHVIRGEEWLPSTPKHVILYKALGYEAPAWAHLGLLLNGDRSKLSKRQGDVAVEAFRDKGFLPSGLVNFVALLGWNPADGNNQEIFQMKELEKHFSIKHVNKAGSVVNVDRLR